MIALKLFPDISATNLSRTLRWHQRGLAEWTLSDWCVALLGEIGEVCEVAEQFRMGWNAKAAMMDEVGDVYAYADLFAQAAGLNFNQCVEAADPMIMPTGTISMAAISMAIAGGKMADVLKKLNRVRDGLGGNKDSTSQLSNQLAFHLGRIGHACALMANGIDAPLELCVSKKFNAVSERMGFPERL